MLAKLTKKTENFIEVVLPIHIKLVEELSISTQKKSQIENRNLHCANRGKTPVLEEDRQSWQPWSELEYILKIFFFRRVQNLKMAHYPWTIKKDALLWNAFNGQKINGQIFNGYNEQNFNLKLGILQESNHPIAVYLSPDDNGKFRWNGNFSVAVAGHVFATNFDVSMNEVVTKMFGLATLLDECRDDELTLKCQIHWEENPNKYLVEVPACNLIEDFDTLLETKEFADVTIVTAGDHKIPAHKTILSARSKVFAAMFRHSMKENTENCVNISDFSYEVIMELLQFIYTGKSPKLPNMTVDLMAAANKYELPRLKAMCARSLSQNLSIETAPIVLRTADLYYMEELKSMAIEFIKTNIGQIRETDNWRALIKTHRKLIIATFIKEKHQEFNLNDTSSSEDEDSV